MRAARQRRGEHAFASLVSGLSQGEQSAAILTMALQTRRRPLIIDQPEDELGYNYVVHLVVPKILETKGTRQILVITHNANIPVLGDADYVLKMENKPLETGDRRCFVEHEGCFESANITYALMELDGGRQAFEFRQYRYALPR
jgi:ABC-type cobalamin/Fe3+-siderophores transport system ATPase subunit